MIRAAWELPFNEVMTTNSTEIAGLSEQVIGRLHDRFPRIPISTIQEIVEEIYHGYDGCRIRAFIPLLVERASRDRLRSLPPRLVNTDTHVQVRASVADANPEGSGTKQEQARADASTGHGAPSTDLIDLDLRGTVEHEDAHRFAGGEALSLSVIRRGDAGKVRDYELSVCIADLPVPRVALVTQSMCASTGVMLVACIIWNG